MVTRIEGGFDLRFTTAALFEIVHILRAKRKPTGA
jgi:hypothetical protein